MTEADIAKARTEWADSFNEVARLRKLLPDQIASERAKHLAAFESALTIPDSMSTDAAMLLVQQNRATELKEATIAPTTSPSGQTWQRCAGSSPIAPSMPPARRHISQLSTAQRPGTPAGAERNTRHVCHGRAREVAPPAG